MASYVDRVALGVAYRPRAQRAEARTTSRLGPGSYDACVARVAGP